MRWVTDLLAGGGSYRLRHNGRGVSKLVLLHGAARFQLVLVSQWTVGETACVKLVVRFHFLLGLIPINSNGTDPSVLSKFTVGGFFIAAT